MSEHFNQAELIESQLTADDFHFFCKLIFKLAGIHLSEKKISLVSSRLKSYLLKNKWGSFSDYRKFLESLPDSHTEIQTFVNLLTTNKTDFFREPQHFDYLTKAVLPQWPAGKEMKVWSCASSTGEEPYTLAMVLHKNLPFNTDFKILATDIDTQVLDKAQNGVYPNAKMTEIPQIYQKQYLTLGKKKAEGWFKIKNPIREQIRFKQHNLNEDSYVGDEVFDIIFCRNVLIYFESNTIRKLMIKLHRSLKKEGLLFIGHSETIQDSRDLFRCLRPSIFRKI